MSVGGRVGIVGAMQILVVFIILGIGADDVFVYSDAWLQSAEDVEREFGEARDSYMQRRVAYAYARALEAIFNTSFTTAVAFFATATSKIMPISTFGIFAAICVLMNYGLVMMACQLTFFTAMGTLIILTVAYSLGYSLLFFMPLLRVAGPEGRVGDICHFLRGLKCACCRRA